MTSPSRRRLGAALCTLVAAAACHDDAFSPTELTGRTYALVRAGDRAVPYVAWASLGDTSQVLADTIIFREAPNATRIFVSRFVEHGVGGRVQTNRVDLHYWVRGGVVEVGWLQPCGPYALCTPNLIGPATGGVLRLVPKEGVGVPVSEYQPVSARD